MAIGRGLGAFAEGFAQGYGQMSEIEARRQATERDKQRMALEEKRAGMEEQRFALDKQLQEQAMQKTGMEIAELKKGEALRNDLELAIANLQKEAQAGYEAEVIDARTNKSQGFKRFQNPQDEIGAMKEKGLFFKPGSIKQVGPMDPTEYQERFGDAFISVHARHAKVTPEMLKQSNEFRKQLRGEGVIEASRYFLTTGDEKGAKEIFNKKGKVQLGDDAQLTTEQDPILGPKVVVLRNGQKVFDVSENIMSSLSTEQYAKILAENKSLSIKEKGETERTRMTVKGAMDRTIYDAKARMLEALSKSKGEDTESLKETKAILDYVSKFASNPNFTWDGGNFMRFGFAVVAQTERNRKKGMPFPEATAKAVTEIPLPAEVTAKPKK